MKIITLKSEIDHKPVAEDFAVHDIPTPSCPDHGVLVRTVHLSLDPYVGSILRGRHLGEKPPIPFKEPIPGAIVGQVLKTQVSGFEVGDWVHSMKGGWQEICAIESSDVRRLDPGVAPIEAHIGVLGMPGLTAWVGVTNLAEVHSDDVVLIDAAAGAVGGTAGQIAKIRGATRVVGIAGGKAKCQMVTETYGFDECIDYQTADWKTKLTEALPEGLSVFFENVSADMAMIALSHANLNARGILCGLVDAYHTESQSLHALNAGVIIGKRAKIYGLVVYDYYHLWDEYVLQAANWLDTGRLKYTEDRITGLENAPRHFERLINGKNIGKSVVTVS